MAYGIKKAGANLAFNGGLFNRNTYIGLLSAETTEFTQTSYARVLMTLADWMADGAALENRMEEAFPRPGATWPAIVGWALYDASTSGNLLLNVDITDTAAPGIGASVSTAAGQLGFSFSGGNLQTAGSLACLQEGLITPTRYITYHNNATPTIASDSGSDGLDDGTGNHINTDGSVGYGTAKTMLVRQIALNQWTLDDPTVTRRRARNNQAINYGTQLADWPDATYSAALRAGNAADSPILFYWPVTATRPLLGATVQIAANAAILDMNITA